MLEQFQQRRENRSWEWQAFIHSLPASPHIRAVKRYNNPHLNADVAPEAFSRAIDAGDIELVATALKNFTLPRASQRRIMHRTVSAKVEQVSEERKQVEHRHTLQTTYLATQGEELPEEGKPAIQEQISDRTDKSIQLDTEYQALQRLQGRLAHPRILERAIDHLSDFPRFAVEELPNKWRRWFPHPILLAYTPFDTLGSIDARFGEQTTLQRQHAEQVLRESVEDGTMPPTAAAVVIRHEGFPATQLMHDALRQRMKADIKSLIDLGAQEQLPSASGWDVVTSRITGIQHSLQVDAANLTALQHGRRQAKYYVTTAGRPVPSLPKRILRGLADTAVQRWNTLQTTLQSKTQKER